MDSSKSFEILIRKKIPYWSEFLMAVMFAFFAFLFLFYLIMTPTGKASGEMKVAYFIIVVPQWLKVASAYSFIGIAILLPIYSISKTYKPATLTFTDENIGVLEDDKEKVIKTETIKQVVFNDVRPILSRNEKMEIIVKDKYHRTTSFLLKDYHQTDTVMEAFSKYPAIELSAYNEIALQMHDDEDNH